MQPTMRRAADAIGQIWPTANSGPTVLQATHDHHTVLEPVPSL